MHKVTRSIYNWILRNKWLAIILAVAAVLRFAGVYPGYPPTHPDETYIYGNALKMIKSVSLDQTRYDYPAFIPLIHVALYMLFFNPIFIVISLIFAPDNLPHFRNLLYFYQYAPLHNQQTAVLFWGRAITAVFGLGIVYMVYHVGKDFFSKKIGLVAAFLVAVNFRQVLNSQIGLPDIYNAFFLLLCFYMFGKLLDNPNRRNYLLSGLALAFFFSTKSQVFPIVTFALIHLLIVWRERGKRSLAQLIPFLFRRDFLIAAMFIPVLYVSINVYQFIHWDEFYKSNHYTTLQYRFGVNSLDFYPISYFFHRGIGQITSLFIVAGLIFGFLKYRFSVLLLLTVVAPFLYLFLYYSGGGFYTRNFITIIPLLLVFAAIFIVESTDAVGRLFKLTPLLLTVVLCLVTVFATFDQIRNSLVHARYFIQPTSFSQARLWADKNIPDGSVVAARPFDKYSNKKQLKRVNFETTNVFSLAEMQEENVSFGYISVDELSNNFYWWMRATTQDSLKYWDKKVPDAVSDNMFSARASQELASWSVATFVKPWQAPDSNYFFVKVPPKLEIKNKKLLKKFDFDSQEGLSAWSLISGESAEVKNILWDNTTGKIKEGAIKIEKAGAYPSVVRAVSPVVVVKNTEGKSKAYEVTVWIKTEEEVSKKERNGYLRVDFYKDDPKTIGLSTRSIYSALSSRIFGPPDWMEKKVTVIPPVGAKYMTVGLEVYNPTITNVWFDDLQIFESEDYFDDPRTKEPYLNNYQLPRDVLFPVSHGNL